MIDIIRHLKTDTNKCLVLSYTRRGGGGGQPPGSYPAQANDPSEDSFTIKQILPTENTQNVKNLPPPSVAGLVLNPSLTKKTCLV